MGRKATLALGSATVVSLVLALMVAPASATSTEPVPAGAGEALAAGIIVKARPGISARSSRVLAGSTLSSLTGVRIATTDSETLPGSSVYRFDEIVPASSLQDTLTWLRMSGTVEWAEPDLILQSARPVLPNDPDFSNQWHLWQGGGARDHSIEAPRGWQYTSGSSDVTVAVLDTGWTEHPDLTRRNINGYDFVSNVRAANDGDGRDGDARDPGDWLTSSEASGYFSGCNEGDSSWHGTHVAGIIAAERGNNRGISGVAPEARVLSVRVLGKCGGSVSDIAAGIRWASGDSVPGVPRNANPAQVINLSLGAPGSCGATFREVIRSAQRNGSIVVAAAGNDGSPVSSSTPANCPGVISVVATNPSGTRPGWSNYGTAGTPAGAAAPGESVLSTYNSGARGPGAPTYSRQGGTSMAAPVVAGAVALLLSVGVKAADVPSALSKLTKSFPSGNCNRVSCGPGLLNLAELTRFTTPDPDPGPGPGPDPTPDPDPGPTPLTAPGIISDVRVRYTVKGSQATAKVTWTRTSGGQRSLYYLYRVKRGNERWRPWAKRISPSLKVERLPRAELSFLEIRGVNEVGRGRVYQITLLPRR